jgi:hypothetical protein
MASDWPGAVTVERFPTSGPVRYFELRSILNRKEEIAGQWCGRWIIHQDSDELRCSPWPAVSLHQGLSRISVAGFSAVEFACIIFRPVDDGFRAGMDPETHFRFFERGATNPPHVQAWCQPPTRVDLAESGGHEATFRGRRVYPEKFILKHYPIRNSRKDSAKSSQSVSTAFTPRSVRQGGTSITTVSNQMTAYYGGQAIFSNGGAIPLLPKANPGRDRRHLADARED